jgi:hypothetical protein
MTMGFAGVHDLGVRTGGQALHREKDNGQDEYGLVKTFHGSSLQLICFHPLDDPATPGSKNVILRLAVQPKRRKASVI